MIEDKTAVYGIGGTMCSFSIMYANEMIAALAGLVTIGYILRKWYLMEQKKKQKL